MKTKKKKALLNSYCYFPFLLLLFFFLKVKPQKQQSSPQKYWILITSSSTYTHILLLEMEFSYKTTITTFLPFSFIFYFLSPTNNPISDQLRPALLSTSTPEVGVFRDSLSLLAVDFAFVVRWGHFVLPLKLHSLGQHHRWNGAGNENPCLRSWGSGLEQPLPEEEQ